MASNGNAETYSFIIETASSVFAEKGIPGTKLDEIAEECNISRDLLNCYIRDKYTLVLACASALFQEIESELFDWMLTVSDDMTAYELCKGLVEVFVGNGQNSKLLTNFIQCADKTMWRGLKKAIKRWQTITEFAVPYVNIEYRDEFEKISKTLILLLVRICTVNTDVERVIKCFASLLK